MTAKIMIMKYGYVRKNLVLIMLICFLFGCKEQNQYQGYVEGYFRYLASNSPGFLQVLAVKRGSTVKAGQIIFVLENQPETAQFLQASQKLQQAEYDLNNLEKGQRQTVLSGIEGQIQQAQANLKNAQTNFYRYQHLIATQAISRQQFDQAKADYEAAQGRYKELIANLNEAKLGARTDVIKSANAAVGAAAAETSSAQWYLAKKTITAPADGVINDTYYNPGEFIAAGKPVASLLVPDDIRVIFYVPQAKLSHFALGQQISVHCDGCAKNYAAVISFIAPEAEFTPPTIFSEQERQKFVFRIEAKINPEDAKWLHPGQPIDVK